MFGSGSQQRSLAIVPSLITDWCDLFVLLSCQAYVFEGNIYYKPGVASQAVSLTHTGHEQQVVNGISDWTYEGKILQLYQKHWVWIKKKLAEVNFMANSIYKHY